MHRLRLLPALLLAVLAHLACGAQTVALTPPMGWNSWDAYGFTIDEAQVKANAAVLAGMRQFGWKYVVVDEGWYMGNPEGNNLSERKYLLDAHGLLIPDAARYPDAADGAGFRPLAAWVHAQGLKFGLHIVRGIPKQAVEENLPIAGTSFHARDAADTTATCPWDEGNYGVADNAAGQAYYDSMLKLYASWGVDFLKADCISDHPYRPTEIRQLAQAIRNAGRPMVLSLSPGPTSPAHAAEIQQWAQMWRISNDHWDAWDFAHHTPDGFPSGIRPAFDLLAKWFTYTGPGSWPDPDMLPEGWLGPHPGWGQPRQTRETPDEQRTEFALWAITRSPLVMGANLWSSWTG
jgi:alpha-galactosidase